MLSLGPGRIEPAAYGLRACSSGLGGDTFRRLTLFAVDATLWYWSSSMHHRLMLWAVVGLATLFSPSGAAQSTPTSRLAAARSQLSALKLDSAKFLVHQVLDSTVGVSRDERIEGWLLLGVIQYYQGSDSGAEAAFRQALAIEPRLDASRLARYDSALVVLFEAQRREVPAHRDSEAPPFATSEMMNCVPRCPKNVTPPTLLHLPDIAWPPSDPDQMPGGRGQLVVRYVVTAVGRVAPSSIVVVSSDVPQGLQSALLLALADATFRPARHGDRPVAVIVEERTELRRELLRTRMLPP